MPRRALRTVGDGGVVICPQAGNRVFPREAPVASMKLKPEGVPRHLGQQDVSAYFPHGETAVTEILEGQLAFLQHVHLCEENHRGTHILKPRLLWKYEFLCCFLGCLSSTDLEGLTQEIDDISRLRHNYSSWSVRSSKALSAALRHDNNLKIGRYMEATLDDLQAHKRLRPFDWQPRKFFAFLMANSKGRFSLWVAPKALVFDRFFDWDFDISVGAIQGHRSRRGGTGGTSYSREMPAVGDDFSCLPQFK